MELLPACKFNLEEAFLVSFASNARFDPFDPFDPALIRQLEDRQGMGA